MAADKPSARPFATDGGRKWMTLSICFGYAFFLTVVVIATAFIHTPRPVQLDTLERIMGFLATTGAIYTGVNGYVSTHAKEDEVVPPDDDDGSDESDEPDV